MFDKNVFVTIPGSTSNFGSGFDTLGMAVNLYQKLFLKRNSSLEIEISSIHSPSIGATHKLEILVREASNAFFHGLGIEPFGFELSLSGDLPVGKGLGASGALRAGLIAGLAELSGRKFSLQQLLNVAASLEHHPDNVSPALLGGFTTSSIVGGEVRCISVQVDAALTFVTAIPEFDMDTEEARKLIPARFPKADVVHSLNRAAMIAAVFAAREYTKLKGLFDDRFHQPHRQKLLPELSNTINAAERAGAVGGWLSGAGSGIMCLALDEPERIGAAMQAVIPQAKIYYLKAENRGVNIQALKD
ncbi:MAG: homoserine kinase [Verrucomicrobiales bacterium]